MIQAIHTRVGGRGRYKIDAMKGCDNLKQLLEVELRFHRHIVRTSANTTTGNLLVEFNPEVDHRHIENILEEFLAKTKTVDRFPVGRKTDASRPSAEGPKLTAVRLSPAV